MERSDRLGTRCKPSDKKKWKKAAKAAGMSLSAWIEQTLNEKSDDAKHPNNV
jgi:predicted HicB family RNase H-like nuclease